MHTSTSTNGFAEARMQVLQGSRVSLPARQQLLDRLFEETGGVTAGQRLTLFLAPVGYGKSSTVASWLGDGSESSEPTRWIDCSLSTPESLWQRIANQLAPFTTSAPAAAPAIQSPTDAIHFAASLRRPMTLVLDKYHVVTSATHDVAVAKLSGASPLLNLVVIARRVSILASPLVTAATRVRIVGTEDLAFSAPERHQLSQALGVAPSEGLDQALTQSEGWPLAIRAALNIGSDVQHLTEPGSAQSNSAQSSGQPPRGTLDPVANLRAFALNYLELTSAHARRVLLAATLLDAISLTQIQHTTHLEADIARNAIHELLELGLMREVPTPTGTHYRCHPSIQGALSPLAVQSFTPTERRQLLLGRAREVEPTAPLAAFTMYCQAEDFAAAETTLARNFTTLTDEVEACGDTLRSVPEAVQGLHPTFTAALLFLEMPKPSVAPGTLEYLTNFWLQSLQKRLPNQSPSESDPIFLQLLCQAMVATRVTGQTEASLSLMRTLESRLTPARVAGVNATTAGTYSLVTEPSPNGSLPTYYRELAATALSLGDFVRARRYLEQLCEHARSQMVRPWEGFGYASTRTVTDQQSGARWLLAALSELAFTELLDGDMRSCARLVAEMDALKSQSGESAPGISWVGAEIARAHLSYELADPTLLSHAVGQLTPIIGRMERWPLLLMAEATALRAERGADLALAYLRAAITNTALQQQLQGEWLETFTAFHALLCTVTGNLAEADTLLSQCSTSSPPARIERARHALFSGDDVTALLIAQSIGDPEATKRQRIDRSLIGAIAAWNCARPDDAFACLAQATEYIVNFGMQIKLQNVPYEKLVEVAVSARDAGVCDLTAFVDAVPVQARSVRYEPLTEMELQSLIAIYTHRNANQAAATLHVTPGTVKKHLVSVYKKLRVNGRDEAILVASRMGLLQPIS